MRSVVIIANSLLIALASAIELQHLEQFDYKEPENVRELYEEFKVKYGKNHANDVDEYRFTVFKDNLKKAKWYEAMDQGTAEYGITKFSDLTAEEFEREYLNPEMRQQLSVANVDVVTSDKVPPESLDWRAKGAVTPVQEQGHCGSCWAFSAIGNVEGQWFLKTGELLKMSEQQLVDCDRSDYGCSGGWPLIAYEMLAKMGGVEREIDYPYVGHYQKCMLNKDKFVAYVNTSMRVSQDEAQIAAYMAEHGPLSMALNANRLQYYTKGILHPFSFMCTATGINHAVLGVGYGIEDKKPYWIVKNSWGLDWGEEVSSSC
ncbi:unnamed protein product [Echinostoma caproni]|uniref:Cysteine proteinase n=1 Tax=Echinostoma caproni TaxID=27848 RepID=A0A183AIX6_9TREM|nr:unnamed protein product [Echinostoma caproni]